MHTRLLTPKTAIYRLRASAAAAVACHIGLLLLAAVSRHSGGGTILFFIFQKITGTP